MPCAHSEWKAAVVRRQKIDECPMQEKTITPKKRKQFPLLPCLRSAPLSEYVSDPKKQNTGSEFFDPCQPWMFRRPLLRSRYPL